MRSRCRWQALAGTEGVHPLFDRRQVAAWLLAHGKIEVPPMLVGLGGAAHRFRLDDPWLDLVEDPGGTDSLSGWSTDEGADAPVQPCHRRRTNNS
ncbi:hypothetical protein [Streptomyces sp. NPDC127112]|uniref:hypothetical protein n=1 Tax=Streptomyces sp. NPDC127112 TaxID=3345364 RepID=UPI0036315E05